MMTFVGQQIPDHVASNCRGGCCMLEFRFCGVKALTKQLPFSDMAMFFGVWQSSYLDWHGTFWWFPSILVLWSCWQPGWIDWHWVGAVGVLLCCCSASVAFISPHTFRTMRASNICQLPCWLSSCIQHAPFWYLSLFGLARSAD